MAVSHSATYATATNRIATITGAPNPTYDANGNLLTITDATGHTYSWDAEGKQLGIDNLSATYDALGRMVELNNSGNYSQVVYGLASEKFALMNRQTLQKAFVSLPSGTAVYTTTGLSYYRHLDWLGSSRLATTPAQGVYSDVNYAAYGEPYPPSAQDISFTGQNPDTTSNLYEFLFRRYSFNQGRWISPDPSGTKAVNPSDPQTWNRYAYVRNNPLTLVDLSGLNQAAVCFAILNWYQSPSGAVYFVGIDSVFCFGGEGGGGGGSAGAGEGGAKGGPQGKVVITNASQSGAQQQTIANRLGQLFTALGCDTDCSSFLAQNGIDPISTLKAVIDNGIYGHADISMDGNPYSTGATNGGVPGMAIVVNNQGSFFNEATPDGRSFSVGPRGYSGGSAKAQGFTLLHELGHLTNVLRRDAGIPQNGKLNDKDIQDHCKKTLDAFK